MADINHPRHYQHPSGIEAIQVCEWENFNIGNALKYLFRCGRKDGESLLDDLRKARWYLDREISRQETVSPKSFAAPSVDRSNFNGGG
jgi:hypothetical protein